MTGSVGALGAWGPSGGASVAQDGLCRIDFDKIGPPVGARMPDIALPNQWGKPVDLHARRSGRRALVVVHRSAGW